MKIACDKCERVADMDGEEYREEWKRVLVFGTRHEMGPQNGWHAEPEDGFYLCKGCYEEVRHLIRQAEA